MTVGGLKGSALIFNKILSLCLCEVEENQEESNKILHIIKVN